MCGGGLDDFYPKTLRARNRNVLSVGGGFREDCKFASGRIGSARFRNLEKSRPPRKILCRYVPSPSMVVTVGTAAIRPPVTRSTAGRRLPSTMVTVDMVAIQPSAIQSSNDLIQPPSTASSTVGSLPSRLQSTAVTVDGGRRRDGSDRKQATRSTAINLHGG